MTAAVALRTEAEAAGVPMRLAAGGGLKLSGSASLELLGRLREHQTEIRALLEAEAEAGLARLGLAGRVRMEQGGYSTTDLSQGQRRRLALLTAMLEDRSVCVFDEWVANQDPESRRAFYQEILPELRAAGKALLVISHDEDYFDVADRVIRLREGRVTEEVGAGGRAT